MGGFYRFPAMTRMIATDRRSQCAKVKEEADEAGFALGDLESAELGLPSVCDFDDLPASVRAVNIGTRIKMCRIFYGMELLDVIHAAETALRMEFGDEEVERLRDLVIRKNQRRGYYGEESWLTARHDLPAGL